MSQTCNRCYAIVNRACQSDTESAECKHLMGGMPAAPLARWKLKPKPTWTTEQRIRFNEFMEATKGLRPRVIGRAMNWLTTGIDWSGCTKGYLAEAWVEGDFYGVGKGLDLKPITMLKRAIERELSGRYS